MIVVFFLSLLLLTDNICDACDACDAHLDLCELTLHGIRLEEAIASYNNCFTVAFAGQLCVVLRNRRSLCSTNGAVRTAELCITFAHAYGHQDKCLNFKNVTFG